MLQIATISCLLSPVKSTSHAAFLLQLETLARQAERRASVPPRQTSATPSVAPIRPHQFQHSGGGDDEHQHDRREEASGALLRLAVLADPTNFANTLGHHETTPGSTLLLLQSISQTQ